MNNCNSCGASFNGDPFIKTWKCEYCGQVNYNKEFLQKHIQTVNTTRVSNLMQIAVVAYQSGAFIKSLEAFENVLQEDSNNIDAWVYAALSAAQTIDLINFDKITPKVENYLKQAEKIASDSDVYLVGRNVANDLICTVLLRGALMRFGEAKKVHFAYNSVDEQYAKSKANEQIVLMASYLEVAMQLPVNNPTLQCEVASVAIQGIKFYFGESPYSELLSKAKSIILSFKDNNPALFQKYAEILTIRSTSNQGCSSFFASSSDKKQPLIGKPVRMLLIIVGSSLALLIIVALLSNTQEGNNPPKQAERRVAYEETTEYDGHGNVSKRTTETKWDKATEYVKEGKYDEALIECNKALAINSNDANAYYQRSVCYFRKDNLDQAIADCNKSIELNPNFANVYFARGTVYVKKGEFNKAISDANRAIQLNPNFAEAYNLRGNAYRKKGDIDKAISDLNKSIEIDPNGAPTYHNRALAYQKKGRLDQAILDSSRAIELLPSLAEAYYVRGVTYFMKKDYDKSWENIHKAESMGCRTRPEDIDALKKASGREK